MKLTPADTHVASGKNRKREGILQQASERGLMVVAVDADDDASDR